MNHNPPSLLNPRHAARKMRRRQERWQSGHRRGGRAVECTGLENQQGLIALRGFESHPLRQKQNGPFWSPSVIEERVRELNPVRLVQWLSRMRGRAAPIPPIPRAQPINLE